MQKEELLKLIKNVADGTASLEDQAALLKELNAGAEEYKALLKQRIDELK